MIITDRFTRGWIAGACGGLVGGIVGFLLYSMKLSTLSLSDWSAILIFGRVGPYSLLEYIYALIIVAGSTGVVGIIFAYLVPVLSEKNIYFKGWIIFLIPWWFIFLVTAITETPGTLNLPLMTPFSNGIETSIAGLVSVFIYRLLDPNSK